MAWPTDADTSATDEGSDDPKQARGTINDHMLKFNQLLAHVSPLMQTFLARTTAAAARGDIDAQQLIDSLSAETSPAVADTLGFYDDSVGAHRKITFANWLKVINGLTAEGSPDGATDYVPVYRPSLGAVRKVLLNDIASAGLWQESFTTSLTSINSVIPVDGTTPTSAEGVQIASIGSVAVGSGQQVEINVDVSGRTTDNWVVATLFRGSTCIAARACETFASPDYANNLEFSFVDSPSAATYTYSLRVGVHTSDTNAYINARSSTPTAMFGGSTMKSGFRLRVLG